MRISDWSSDVCSSDLREVRSTARAKARSSPRSARAGEGVAGVASSFNPSNMPRLGFSPWTRPGAGRSIGFGLLLLAIYIPTPVAFSSFPSVLLLTTLFRLALSIAITRSILPNAEGGHIVETFDTMVAGGNLALGLGGFLR